MKLLIFCILGSVAEKNIITKFNLTMAFLENNNARACVFMVCWSKYEMVYMQKLIQNKLSIQIGYFPVHDNVDDGNIHFKDEKYGKVNYIIDMSCERSYDILEKTSRWGKFRFTYSWLIIYDMTIGNENIEVLFSGLKLRADMDVTVASLKNHQSGYDIFIVYKPGLEVDIVVKNVGEFLNHTFNYFAEKKSSFYESRKNLSGVLIRTGNTVNYSFEIDKEYEQARRYKEIGTFGKYHFQLLLILREIHNFHYNTTLRNAWFGNSSSGIDSGVASLLNQNKIDLMSSGGILRYGRMDYYDFLAPYFEFRTCFFFRNPGTVKPGAEVLKPFSIRTWYATIGVGFLMGTAIKFSYWVEHKYFNSNTRYSFFTSLVITISILAQQGSAILPTHLGGRIIFLTILIISMLLYNYYTSSLVSSLLSTKPTVFTTIKELYESNLKVAVENQPYTITYIIQQFNNVYIQKLNTTKIYNSGIPNFLPPEDGVELVKTGEFAYHTDASTAYPLIARSFDQNLICDLAEINFVPPGILGLLVQKRSEYTELFQISLVKMRVAGIFKRERDIWSSKKPECLLSSRVVSVGINELFLVYMILLAGVFISSIVLIIEIVSFQFEIRNNERNLVFVN